MAAVPELPQQDPRMAPGGYDPSQLSSLLPEVQTGSADRSAAISYHDFTKARRQDAELNLMKSQIRSALFYLRYNYKKTKREAEL